MSAVAVSLETPDTALAVLLALGCGTLLGPWWVQLAWLVLVALVETWYQLEAVSERAHADGW